MTDAAADRAEPADRTPLLEVRDLKAGYGQLQALWGVGLDAYPGEVSLVLGRNGAGKTTTLRAIAGLTHARAGEIRFAGRVVNDVAPHRRSGLGMAFVQEGKRVFVDRTVEENLVLGTYTKRWSKRQRRDACERAYERFPVLASRRDRRAGALSGGQQQMLAIAAALASEPSLLLLDEPSAGLAPAIVQDVLTVVRASCVEGLAVVLVEQNAERALTVADHVTVLDLGRVTVDVPASQADVSALVRAAYFDVPTDDHRSAAAGSDGDSGTRRA